MNFINTNLTRFFLIFILICSGCFVENEYKTAHIKFINSRLESLSIKKNLIIDLMRNIEEDQENGKEQDILIYKWDLLLNNVDLILEESKITIDSMIVHNVSIEYITNSRISIGIINSEFLINNVDMKHHLSNRNLDDTKKLLNRLETIFNENINSINTNIEEYLQEIGR